MKFGNLTMEQFLSKLSSSEPLPGGGSAGAICAAMGAALAAMTARGALGKKAFQDRADELSALADRADKLMHRLVGLSEKDAEAYGGVLSASRMAQDTQEQIEARDLALRKAFREAVSVPLDTLKASEDLMEAAILAIRKGNPRAKIDAASAAYLAWAAAGISAMIVRTNVIFIHDRAVRDRALFETEFTLERIESLSKEAERLVNEYLDR